VCNSPMKRTLCVLSFIFYFKGHVIADIVKTDTNWYTFQTETSTVTTPVLNQHVEEIADKVIDLFTDYAKKVRKQKGKPYLEDYLF